MAHDVDLAAAVLGHLDRGVGDPAIIEGDPFHNLLGELAQRQSISLDCAADRQIDLTRGIDAGGDIELVVLPKGHFEHIVLADRIFLRPRIENQEQP